jgi:OmpA-OmpF porin, OOP family
MNMLPGILLIFLIAAPASGAPQLAPESGRITDQTIAGDLQSLTALQQRLADLNSAASIPVGVYHFAKAQAWIDMAMDNYVMNDRTRVIEDAVFEAWRLIDKMERKEQNLPMSTPILPTSKVVRQDLWDLAARYKLDPRFSCAEDTVAQLEVQLVWTGHEENQLGWRHAKPYLQAAERLAREARRQMDACASGSAVVLATAQTYNQPRLRQPRPYRLRQRQLLRPLSHQQLSLLHPPACEKSAATIVRNKLPPPHPGKHPRPLP